jgi:ribonucleoside-diphosphate reductase beta chain
MQQQQSVHWLPTEVNLAPDIQDFSGKLSDAERSVYTNILRLFTQSEIHVNDIWRKVPEFFPKPEVSMMAATFSSFEAIHTWAYAYLNDSLGLPEAEYSAFINESSMRKKVDYLMEGRNIPLTLETLAFTEGVSLFSSFAVLLNPSRFNKLKALGQIISWSVRDESLHSMASCYLFRTYLEEQPSLFSDELKKEVYEMAKAIVKLEDNFIDRVFAMSPDGVEGLSVDELKTFIRHRANVKLGDLGLKPIWRKQGAAVGLPWFDVLVGENANQEFLAGRVSEYSKGVVQFDDSIFEF